MARKKGAAATHPPGTETETTETAETETETAKQQLSPDQANARIAEIDTFMNDKKGCNFERRGGLRHVCGSCGAHTLCTVRVQQGLSLGKSKSSVRKVIAIGYDGVS